MEKHTIEGRRATFRLKKPAWPHAHLPPEAMAMAGWHFNPVPGSADNVACSYCNKNLDGWAEDDHPWREHVSHAKQCPLVTLNLQESREKTFDHWPHAKPSKKELSAAGFFYYPKDRHDDTAYCFQCGCSLDGWEPTDDPRHEHARRFPRCPFLVTACMLEPAAFQRILASSTDKYVKEIPEAVQGVAKQPKEVKEVKDAQPKRRATVQRHEPAPPAPPSVARRAGKPRASTLAVAQTPQVAHKDKSRQPATARTVSDADLMAKVGGVVPDPTYLDMPVDTVLRKLASDKLAAFDRESSQVLASLDT